MKIVSLVGLSEADAERIRAVDTSIDLELAGGWFNGEYRDTWPEATASRYLTDEGHGTREDRDALLAGAEVIIAGFPFPLDLMARTPNVKWVHQTLLARVISCVVIFGERRSPLRRHEVVVKQPHCGVRHQRHPAFR